LRLLGIIQSAEHVTISASAVNNVCLFSKIELDNLVDYGEDWQSLELVRRDGKYYHTIDDKVFDPPTQGMFVKTRVNENKEPEGFWHVLGGTLFKFVDEDGKATYWLCALDEQNYFCAQLPTEANTVHKAFEALKPQEVQDYEAQGKTAKRQGEWFFIPTDLTDRHWADLLQVRTLAEFRKGLSVRPLPNPHGGNEHVCRYITVNGAIFAQGTVRHVTPSHIGWDGHVYGGNATGEHKALKLGNVWHEVYRNTEIKSYVNSGGVD